MMQQQPSFVLGYPVHVSTREALVAQLSSGLAAGHHQHVVTLNPEMLMAGDQNPALAQVLKSAEVVLPDGAGLVWALKRKIKQVERIPGIEFSELLIAKAAQEGDAIALIGAKPEVNAAACAGLKKRFPGLEIAFAHHGYFENEEEKWQIAQECARTRPKYVFVALGVPAQEFWIHQFKSLFLAPTAFIGVGGSFDIWSGMKQRAHPLFLHLNLEWLYRITTEPFRLKRVYKTLPMFVVKVLLDDKQPVTANEYRHVKPNSPEL